MIKEINIKIKNFEGPLDLLLHLVSQYEMDIFEVPLVPVIEQYLIYIQTMKELELEVAGEYMLMASQLMLIKSEDFYRQLPKLLLKIQNNLSMICWLKLMNIGNIKCCHMI